MTTENLTETLPTTPTTLDAQTCLRFLELVEGGMPKGTRAYLVGLQEDGRRYLCPVAEGKSVVALGNSRELIDHFNSAPVNRAVLEDVHSYCAERLDKRKATPKEYTAVAIEATYELEALCQAIVHALPLPSADSSLYALRGMALRAAALNSILMSILTDEAVSANLDSLHKY